MTTNYDDLRVELSALMRLLEDKIPLEDRTQIRMLLDADEFGVALEWLVDVFVEDGKQLSTEARTSIEALANRMGIHADIARRLSVIADDH